jgi:hypothetical protein
MMSGPYICYHNGERKIAATAANGTYIFQTLVCDLLTWISPQEVL